MERQKVSGKMTRCYDQFPHMHRCIGCLPSEVMQPQQHNMHTLNVAFDEGAKSSTSTIDFWECHSADWEEAYTLFTEREHIGSAHGNMMKDGVRILDTRRNSSTWC